MHSDYVRRELKSSSKGNLRNGTDARHHAGPLRVGSDVRGRAMTLNIIEDRQATKKACRVQRSNTVLEREGEECEIFYKWIQGRKQLS